MRTLKIHHTMWLITIKIIPNVYFEIFIFKVTYLCSVYAPIKSKMRIAEKHALTSERKVCLLSIMLGLMKETSNEETWRYVWKLYGMHQEHFTFQIKLSN